MNTFDVVVVGGGPGGERAAIQAAKAGRRVALVERENVIGGMRVNWGTIPSKTLRHAFGIPGPKLRTERLPFAIYAIPEVSYIGESEESLRQQGIPYAVGRGHYETNPKGQIVAASGGLVKLLVSSGRT